MKEKMYKILCEKRKIEMCKEIMQGKTKRRFDEEVNKIERWKRRQIKKIITIK
jgi:hypothetical protein